MAYLLQVAGLPRSTFYYQCQASQRADQQSALEARIRTVYDEHKGRYGYRRITAALCNAVVEPINHKCVQRLMRKMGLRALIRVLEAALARTACTGELIVHSDQGWHYKMQPYRAMLVQRGVKQSMSRKGNCFDNAAIESFFGTLKAKYFRLAAPDSLDTLEAGVHDYIHYYNHERIKLRLSGLSPVGYRLRNSD